MTAPIPYRADRHGFAILDSAALYDEAADTLDALSDRFDPAAEHLRLLATRARAFVAADAHRD